MLNLTMTDTFQIQVDAELVWKTFLFNVFTSISAANKAFSLSSSFWVVVTCQRFKFITDQGVLSHFSRVSQWDWLDVQNSVKIILIKILISFIIITSCSLVLSSSTSSCVDFFTNSATSSSALFDLTCGSFCQTFSKEKFSI